MHRRRFRRVRVWPGAAPSGWALFARVLLALLVLQVANGAPMPAGVHEPEADHAVEASWGPFAAHQASHDAPGHRHSGSPLHDLLTVGHTHAAGAPALLSPSPWRLVPAAGLAETPRSAGPVRPPGDDPRDSVFRPPIA